MTSQFKNKKNLKRSKYSECSTELILHELIQAVATETCSKVTLRRYYDLLLRHFLINLNSYASCV